jgi:hypothetical protein
MIPPIEFTPNLSIHAGIDQWVHGRVQRFREKSLAAGNRPMSPFTIRAFHGKTDSAGKQDNGR